MTLNGQPFYSLLLDDIIWAMVYCSVLNFQGAIECFAETMFTDQGFTIVYHKQFVGLVLVNSKPRVLFVLKILCHTVIQYVHACVYKYKMYVYVITQFLIRSTI